MGLKVLNSAPAVFQRISGPGNVAGQVAGGHPVKRHLELIHVDALHCHLLFISGPGKNVSGQEVHGGLVIDGGKVNGNILGEAGIVGSLNALLQSDLILRAERQAGKTYRPVIDQRFRFLVLAGGFVENLNIRRQNLGRIVRVVHALIHNQT